MNSCAACGLFQAEQKRLDTSYVVQQEENPRNAENLKSASGGRGQQSDSKREKGGDRLKVRVVKTGKSGSSSASPSDGGDGPGNNNKTVVDASSSDGVDGRGNNNQTVVDTIFVADVSKWVVARVIIRCCYLISVFVQWDEQIFM